MCLALRTTSSQQNAQLNALCFFFHSFNTTCCWLPVNRTLFLGGPTRITSSSSPGTIISERRETVTDDSAELLRTGTSTANVGGVTYSFVSSCFGWPTFFRWRYMAICWTRSFDSTFKKPHASMHCGMVALGHFILNATACLTRSDATTLILGMLAGWGINVTHRFGQPGEI